MSQDDADISMSSIRGDESFDMSIDHGTVDIVWHSTQPPAIQSILEESKYGSPLNFGMELPKSLYRDASAPRSQSLYGPQATPLFPSVETTRRPNATRSDSLPAFCIDTPTPQASSSSSHGVVDIKDVRRIRPSQRRLFLNTTQPHSGLSQNTGTGTTKTQALHPTYSLENLNDMIKNVGKTWGMDNASSDLYAASQARRQSSSPSSASSHSSHVFPRVGNSSPITTSSNYGESHSKPRIATTIKIGRYSGSSGEPDTRSRQTKSTKGLMLPPTIPVSYENASFHSKDPEELYSDTDPDSSPQDTVARETPRFSRLKIHEEQSTTNSTDDLTFGSRPSQNSHSTLLDVKSSVPPSQERQRKPLGMRRTVSTGTTSNYKSSQATQAPETGVDLIAKPKPFKVPWTNTSRVSYDAVGSLRMNNGTSGTPHSSDGVSKSNKELVNLDDDDDIDVSGRSSEMDHDRSRVDNPDSSYSFDEIDPEELHQVLSQRGA
ncbi:hypothetical protein CPB86DRAFT_344364 [Serendipita vermifera]|nr:hypothetical protein CPB86DRAFT_344364 [Serendipita vermifera]